MKMSREKCIKMPKEVPDQSTIDAAQGEPGHAVNNGRSQRTRANSVSDGVAGLHWTCRAQGCYVIRRISAAPAEWLRFR